MKKQKLYNRIQKQYKNLSQNIQKTMQTGRFYEYTKFKQQQLLYRLKRSSLQLKELGLGVAVSATLGMATPVLGQYPYILTEQTGIDNPIDSLILGFHRPEFVDINGDGDLDIFVDDYRYGYVTRFLENTGSPTNPVFVERINIHNPMDLATGVQGYGFVDIDADGDMDCFAGSKNYSYGIDNFFYKNTGTATNPVFLLESDANNPLHSVKADLIALNGSNQYYELEPHFSFADIDADGDMDCFVSINSYHNNPLAECLWYYENVGTATVPTFVKISAANNPFSRVLSYYSSHGYFAMSEAVTFADTDNDGDMDAVLNIVGVPSIDWWIFCENKGTVLIPDFDTVSVSPIAMASSGGLFVQAATLVDINNDSKLDVFRVSAAGDINYPIFTGSIPAQFFLNEMPTDVSSVERKSAVLHSFPNPTSGVLLFDKKVTGIASLRSIAGQEIMTKVLSKENQLNLSSIPRGMYTLSLSLEDDTMYSKIIFIED